MPKSNSFYNSIALIPRIISYNVNSLSYYATDPSRTNNIRTFIQDSLRKADIICLQETNLATKEQQALSHINAKVPSTIIIWVPRAQRSLTPLT